MFNVATQQHYSKVVKVAAVEGGEDATEAVEVSGYLVIMVSGVSVSVSGYRIVQWC